MGFKRYTLIAVMLLLSFSVQGEPVAWGGTWQTLSSAHFDIHYPKELQASAEYALDVAEKVHQELTPLFAYEPKRKTQMTLVDDFDYSNGWASPVPFAQIRLIASPPSAIDGLENYSAWLYLLIRHEYTHILQMNLAKGAPDFFQHLFGRQAFFFPHALLPSTLIEGLAVYMETLAEGSGRLAGSYYEMLMRQQVATGKLLELNQVVVPNPHLSHSEVYLYGAYFIQFLAQTYGEDKLSALIQAYASNVIPYFFIHFEFRRIYHKDLDILWSEYQTWLKQRFSNAQQEEDTQRLSLEKNSRPMRFGLQQERIYLSQNNGFDQPKLKVIQPTQTQTLAMAYQLTDFAISEQGKIAGVKRHVYPTGEVFNDIYLLKGTAWQRLTHKQRVYQVAWFKRQTSLIFSTKRKGISQIWQYQIATPNKRALLWQGTSEQVIGSFTLAPDKSSLVMSLNTQGKGWNLYRLQFDTKKITPITQTRWTENTPYFQDAEHLLFSADYTGAYQIYQLNLITGKLIQQSNEAGGAFNPAYSFELGLVYQSYQRQNYQIKQIAEPKAYRQQYISELISEKNMPSAKVVPTEKSAPTDYSPLPWVLPQAWWPTFKQTEEVNQFGLSVSGSDPLGQHNYSLSYAYDVKNKLHSGSLSYLYDNRWQGIFLQSHQLISLPKSLQSGNKTHTAIEKRSWLLARHHLLDLFADKLEFRLGVSSETSKIKELKYFQRGVKSYYQKNLVGLAAVFKNQEYYALLPYIGRGLYWDFVVQNYDLLNSDADAEQYQSLFSYSFDLPKSNQITVKLQAGYSSIKTARFALGGQSSTLTNVFLREGASLAGYEKRVQAGAYYGKGELSINSVLAEINQNWQLYPIGLGDIYSRLYVNTGSAWSDNRPQWLTGIGGSLNVQLKLGYNFTLPIGFGIAQGLDTHLGKTQYYMQIIGQF